MANFVEFIHFAVSLALSLDLSLPASLACGSPLDRRNRVFRDQTNHPVSPTARRVLAVMKVSPSLKRVTHAQCRVQTKKGSAHSVLCQPALVPLSAPCRPQQSRLTKKRMCDLQLKTRISVHRPRVFYFRKSFEHRNEGMHRFEYLHGDSQGGMSRSGTTLAPDPRPSLMNRKVQLSYSSQRNSAKQTSGWETG